MKIIAPLPLDEHPDALGFFTRYHIILPHLNANLMNGFFIIEENNSLYYGLGMDLQLQLVYPDSPVLLLFEKRVSTLCFNVSFLSFCEPAR